MPVTSTSVAANAVEALAGSNPGRRSGNGSIEPAMDPKVTTPTRMTSEVACDPKLPLLETRGTPTGRKPRAGLDFWGNCGPFTPTDGTYLMDYGCRLL
jgi:hypothetical protein